MVQRHLAKAVREGTSGNPEESELFKANKEAIQTWETDKLEVLRQAHQVVLDAQAQAEKVVTDDCLALYRRAELAFNANQKADVGPEDKDTEMDGALMAELQSLTIESLQTPAKANQEAGLHSLIDL